MKMSPQYFLAPLLLIGLSGCNPGSPGAGTAPGEPPAALRWHFVGGLALSSDASNPTLAGATKVASASMASGALATNIVRAIAHLSGIPATQWPTLQSGAVPVVRELLGAESLGEMRSRDDWHVAVRLPSATAAFQRELPSLTGGAVQVVSTNGWVIAARTLAGIHSGTAATRKSSAPLEIHASMKDWPKETWPSHLLPPPEIHLTAANSNGAVRWTGKAKFPTKLPFQLDAWKIPPGVIRQPLASFLAMRGTSDWLAKSGLFGNAPGFAIPNQFLGWTQPGPFRSFVIAPSAISDTIVESAFKSVDTAQRSDHPVWSTMGQFMYDSTNHMIRLATRMPMQPALMTLKTPGQDYLFAAFNPTRRSTNPVPAELFQQLEPDNVVGYHWEVTGECLQSWRDHIQFHDVVTHGPLVSSSAPIHQWVEQAGEKAAASATVLRQVSPDTLEITRRAPLGLTAPELLLLARWLDSDHAKTPGKRTPRPGLPPAPPSLPGTK